MGGRGATSSGGGGSGGQRLNLANPREQQNYPIAEANALRQYTKTSSINKKLGIDGYDNLSPSDKEYVNNLDKAISKSGFNEDWTPTAGEPAFIRGAGGTAIGIPKTMNFHDNQELADYINANLMNKTTANAGYTSITTKGSIAKSFAGGKKNGVVLEYQMITKGTRGAYVSGGKGKTAISFFDDSEDETICQRNMKTTVVGKAYVGNDNRVHVPVIGSK